MQSIKFYKKYDTHLAKIGDTEYKGYAIGDLPPSFGFIYKQAGQEGKSTTITGLESRGRMAKTLHTEGIHSMVTVPPVSTTSISS